jgi:hypothetical protein
MSRTAILEPRVGRPDAEGGQVVPFRPRPTRGANGAVNDAPPFPSLPGIPTPDLTAADVYDAIRAVFQVHKRYRMRRIGMRLTVACALLLAFAGGVWLPERGTPAADSRAKVAETPEPPRSTSVEALLGRGVAGAAATPEATTGGPIPGLTDATSAATAEPTRAFAGPTAAVEATTSNPPALGPPDPGEEPLRTGFGGFTSAVPSDPAPSSPLTTTAAGRSVGSGSVHASGGVTRSELATYQPGVVRVRNEQGVGVNVRPRPLAEGEVVRSVAPDEAVDVLCVAPGERNGDPNGPWYRLVVGGWVSSTAVTLERGTPPPCAGG